MSAPSNPPFWPTPSHLRGTRVFRSKLAPSSLIKSAEDAFCQLAGFNGHAVLVPSGRSGLSQILQYLKLSRGISVFAPRFSPHCLWDAISPIADPTTDPKAAQVRIAVHSLGVPQKFKSKSDAVVIEDSVDTLLAPGAPLFINGGLCELVSLSKTVGSLSGGMILTQDSRLRDFIVNRRTQDSKLALEQAERKISAKPDWGFYESSNTGLAELLVRDMLERISLGPQIQIQIRERMEFLQSEFGNLDFNYLQNRLPPAVAFPLKGKVKSSRLTQRSLNQSPWIEKSQFIQCALLPIHCNVEHKKFVALAKQLKKIRCKT